MSYEERLGKILQKTLKAGASDLHLCVGRPPVIRVKGKLAPLKGEDVLKPEDSRELANCLLSETQRERFLAEKEIDFGYELAGISRFRINVYLERGNVSTALRIISEKIRTIEELQLPPVLHRLSEASHGFVLITGASSQGKSTTLAALIDEINHKRGVHIITIEDPIEYVFPDDKALIEQREVHNDTLSFARALRSTLREDPDVIMVGEMRDLETISTAITAAETGHLVFATLHTNSASQTINRIVDVFPSHQQNQIKAELAGSLLAAVSQRLVSTVKGELLPVCEVMFNTSAISNLIREGKIHEIPTIIETSKEEGMLSLNASLAEKVAQKKITKEIALNYSLNPEDLKYRMGEIK